MVVVNSNIGIAEVKDLPYIGEKGGGGGAEDEALGEAPSRQIIMPTLPHLRVASLLRCRRGQPHKHQRRHTLPFACHSLLRVRASERERVRHRDLYMHTVS